MHDVTDKLNSFTGFLQEFRSESDRGCAVLVLCVLEDILRDIFLALVADPDAKLDTLMPPGEISIATENAVLLGLINKEEAQLLRGLAGARNAFAHGAWSNLKFDSPKVASRIGNLVAVLPMSREYLKSKSPREQFVIHAFLLHSALMYRYAEAKRLAPARRLESLEDTVRTLPQQAT